MTFARVDPNNLPPLPSGFQWNNGQPTYGGGASSAGSGPNFYQAQGQRGYGMRSQPNNYPFGAPYAPRSSAPRRSWNWHPTAPPQPTNTPTMNTPAMNQPPAQGSYPFQFPPFDPASLGNFFTPHQPGQAQNVPNSAPGANFLGAAAPPAPSPAGTPDMTPANYVNPFRPAGMKLPEPTSQFNPLGAPSPTNGLPSADLSSGLDARLGQGAKLIGDQIYIQSRGPTGMGPSNYIPFPTTAPGYADLLAKAKAFSVAPDPVHATLTPQQQLARNATTGLGKVPAPVNVPANPALQSIFGSYSPPSGFRRPDPGSATSLNGAPINY